MARLAWALSNCPSHRATTIVATALPMRLVMARADDKNRRSAPRSSASPNTGIAGTAARVAANVMRAAASDRRSTASTSGAGCRESTAPARTTDARHSPAPETITDIVANKLMFLAQVKIVYLSVKPPLTSKNAAASRSSRWLRLWLYAGDSRIGLASIGYRQRVSQSHRQCLW